MPRELPAICKMSKVVYVESVHGERGMLSEGIGAGAAASARAYS